MAVTMILTLKKKVLAISEDSCLRVCLRLRVAPLRCSFILGSGKVKKRFSNLYHYQQDILDCTIYFNTISSFAYVYRTNLVSRGVIC